MIYQKISLSFLHLVLHLIHLILLCLADESLTVPTHQQVVPITDQADSIHFLAESDKKNNLPLITNELADKLDGISLNTTVSGSRQQRDILAHSDVMDSNQSDVYQYLISHLKTIYHNRQKVHDFGY